MSEEAPSSEDGDVLTKLYEVLDALNRANAPVRYKIVTHGRYQTARLVLEVFGGLGWAGVVLGGLLLAIGASGGGGPYSPAAVLMLPLGMALLIGGILVVVQCQSARASIDGADYARQSLEIQALRVVGRSTPQPRTGQGGAT